MLRITLSYNRFQAGSPKAERCNGLRWHSAGLRKDAGTDGETEAVPAARPRRDLGGAFCVGYREEWIRAGMVRSEASAYNVMSADCDRAIGDEPLKAWAHHLAKFQAQLPLVSLPVMTANSS